jgi:CheY-like chemotaxis protein
VLRPLTVLVVEDHKVVRDMLLCALPRLDPAVSVEGVATLALARQRLEAAVAVPPRGGPIDAVLTDLMLEDADGVEAVEVLRGIAPSVPVVVLTGLPTLASLAVSAGASEVHDKGTLHLASLLKALRRAAIRHDVSQEVQPLRDQVDEVKKDVEALGVAVQSDSQIRKAR